MKITTSWVTNLKIKEVNDKVDDACRRGLVDTVMDIANDTIKGSPVLTGNNMRSIKYEVGPGGEVAKTDKEGAIYSTSGYGGMLETGTSKMPARPYFKPALDMNFKNLPNNIKGHLQ